MAVATKDKVTVTKTVKVTEDEIVLHLTVEEAETLYSVIRHVGGPPRTTRRNHLNDISAALYASDVKDPRIRYLKGQEALYFADPDEIALGKGTAF